GAARPAGGRGGPRDRRPGGARPGGAGAGRHRPAADPDRDGAGRPAQAGQARGDPGRPGPGRQQVRPARPLATIIGTIHPSADEGTFAVRAEPAAATEATAATRPVSHGPRWLLPAGALLLAPALAVSVAALV